MPVVSVMQVAALVVVGVAATANSDFESWLAAHPITTPTTTIVSKTAQALKATPNNDIRFSNADAFNACPVTCGNGGIDPKNWTAYHSLERLAICDKTMLLDFNLFNDLNNSSNHKSIYACTADDMSSLATSIGKGQSVSPDTRNVQTNDTNIALQLIWVNSDDSESPNEIQSMIGQLK